MVKRQSVRLSTLMVFTLMLIGYYTLGSPTGSISKVTAGNATTGSTTVVTTGPNGTTVPTSSSASTHTSHKGVGSTAIVSQPSDWFVQTTMDMSNEQAKIIQTLQTTLSDPRASNAAVSAAFAELTALQTQQANASRVHDELVADGYPDSVVVFNPHNDVRVYVQATKMTPVAAVKVINIASQTLGVQSNQITVSAHA